MQTIFITAPLDDKLSTAFAAHIAIALADHFQTALIDGNAHHDALQMFLAKRHHLNLASDTHLPVPAYFAASKNVFEQLSGQYDFAVVNAKNLNDAARADILVILASNDDEIHLLSKTDGEFAKAVWDAKKRRAAGGNDAFSSVVIASEASNNKQFIKTASMIGYLLAPPMKNPTLYIKGFERGMTILDKNLPAFQQDFGVEDFFARRNFKEMMEYILAHRNTK
ncbi:MAG: hypothetical protein IKR60_01485 [Alphaproteobacteria bacterium]|nr:hypothetical protein [Alphaproteobacteria bacterium]